MAKPEWGQKRTCTSCTCRFYDMHRSPITCPKCGGTVEPELPFKVRRGGSVPSESKAAAAALKAKEAVAVVADDLVALDDEDVIEGAEETADEDESGLIEDASDLGEDDDDMAEVMEHMDEEMGDEV
ncbi:MAG: TIGR02300 family protein [Rhodospirillaceae bacterium]|nr:TIGR02300 family protein [Rhodospirillales bacterium]